MGINLGFAFSLHGTSAFAVAAVLPILAKLGGKFDYNIGPGILFTEVSMLPGEVSHRGYDFAFFGFIGYKVGVGRNSR